MKMIKITSLLLLLLSLLSCTKKENEDVKNDYLVFGQFYGFCDGECETTYKLTNTQLFYDIDKQYNRGKSFNFSALNKEEFETAKDLMQYIPKELSATTASTIGCPDCVDQGGILIQYYKNGVLKSWKIDSNINSIPEYLHDFITKVSNKINVLKNRNSVKNKLLLLKVDYKTNVFEGGKEFIFPTSTSSFTVSNEYNAPSDFGNIKLFYKELNEKIFDGEIIWNGKGEIKFPTSFEPASSFNVINTLVPFKPFVFENVFNPNNEQYDYSAINTAISYLEKVNDYRNSKPTAKIFLYTPSIGMGNPADWKWIIILKNNL